MTDISQPPYSYLFDNEKLDRLLKWPDRPTVFGIRLSALVETIVFLAGVVLLSTFLGDGTRYISSPLHPFWIIVLVVTVQYGLKEAIAAAALSSAFLLVGNLPEQPMNEGPYEYFLRVFSQPLLWLSVALVLGGIRQRQLGEKVELVDEFNRLEESLTVIVKGYQELKSAKERLEMRLSEERCGLITSFGIARALETIDAEQAHIGIEKLITTALKNPTKFSIFAFEDDKLVLSSSHGWASADEFTTSFAVNDELTKAIAEKHSFLNIAQRKDEAILGSEGLMAGPIFDEKTHKVYGMLKIEDANFTSMDSRTEQTFRLVCGWIGQVSANVTKFEDAMAHKGTSSRKKGLRPMAGVTHTRFRADSEPSSVVSQTSI